MKKEHIYFFLVLATFIVSFISLGISLPRCDWSNDMDYLGVIVGILAVLVTVLIGLQLYNYIYARENIKQIIDEQIRNMLQDYGHTTDARDCLQNGFELVVSDFDCPRITDAIMKALQEVAKCESAEMRQQTLDYIMNEAHKLCTEYSKDERTIKKGMRADYLHIIKQIDHKYVPELTEYLKTAVEKA